MENDLSRKNSNIPSKILLNYTKPKRSFHPYLHESLSVVTRNLVRSFIHAYFLPFYQTQITLLFLTDIYCLFLAHFNRKLFINSTVCTLVFIYYALFCLLDGFFTLRCLQSHIFSIYSQ